MYQNLHYAVFKGALEDVKYLLSKGADINHRHYDVYGGRVTPLIIAAYWGCLDVLYHLIDAGADLNLTDDWGGTALSAALRGDADISIKKAMILALLNAGINPNIGKHNIIHQCAFRGELDIASTLMAYGARPKAGQKLLYSSLVSTQVRGAFEDLVSAPPSLQNLTVKLIRSCVSRDNISKLPLPPGVKGRYFSGGM